MRRIRHNSNRTGPIASNQFGDDENAGDRDGDHELLDRFSLLFFLLRQALLEIYWSLHGHRRAKLIVLLAQGSFLLLRLFFLNHILLAVDIISLNKLF